MRILGLLGTLPTATSPAGPPRALALLRLLADAGHEVRLIVGEPLGGARRTLADAAATAIGGPVTAAAGAERVPPGTEPLRWALPLRLGAEHLTPLARAARAFAPSVDVVLSLDAAGHGAASAVSGRVATAMDLHHLQGVREDGDWARTSAQRWTIQPRRSWERRVVARAMGLIAPSAEARHRADRLYYRRPAVVPTPVTAAPTPPAGAGGSEQRGFIVGWFGDTADPAERAGLDLLTTEIWPRIGDPSAELLLADAAAPAALDAVATLDGAHWVHPGAGLPELAAQCTIAIRPTWRAGGDGAATLALMAAGLPVVGTPQAFEGVSVRNGIEALIADDPGRLLAALRTLAHDPASTRAIAAQGRQHVLRHHGSAAVTAALLDAIETARNRFEDYAAGRVANPLDPAGVKRELDAILHEARAAGRRP